MGLQKHIVQIKLFHPKYNNNNTTFEHIVFENSVFFLNIPKAPDASQHFFSFLHPPSPLIYILVHYLVNLKSDYRKHTLHGTPTLISV